MVAHLLPRGALLLAALVARAAAQGAPQGDAASDTAALLAIRAVGNNAAHLAMVTWTAGTEPCDAASWSEDQRRSRRSVRSWPPRSWRHRNCRTQASRRR